MNRDRLEKIDYEKECNSFLPHPACQESASRFLRVFCLTSSKYKYQRIGGMSNRLITEETEPQRPEQHDYTVTGSEDQKIRGSLDQKNRRLESHDIENLTSSAP